MNTYWECVPESMERFTFFLGKTTSKIIFVAEGDKNIPWENKGN